MQLQVIESGPLERDVQIDVEAEKVDEECKRALNHLKSRIMHAQKPPLCRSARQYRGVCSHPATVIYTGLKSSRRDYCAFRWMMLQTISTRSLFWFPRKKSPERRSCIFEADERTTISTFGRLGMLGLLMSMLARRQQRQ